MSLGGSPLNGVEYEDPNDLLNIKIRRPLIRPPTSSTSSTKQKPSTATHSRQASGVNLTQGYIIGIACPPVNAYHLNNINEFSKDINGKGGEIKYKLKSFLTNRKQKECNKKKSECLLQKKLKALDELDRHRKMKERVIIHN